MLPAEGLESLKVVAESIELLTLARETPEQLLKLLAQFVRVVKHEPVVSVPNQFREAAEIEGTDWETAAEHIDNLHGEVQPTGGGVQADAHVSRSWVEIRHFYLKMCTNGFMWTVTVTVLLSYCISRRRYQKVC